MRRFIYVLALVSCAAAYAAQLTPEEVVKSVGFDQRLNADLPLDLNFRDETGRPTQLQDCFHSGRPVVLVMGYYKCPMLCSAVLSGLTSCLRMITLNTGSDFDVIMVSIDPSESATLAAEKKAEYLKQYRRPGSSDGWHFLTGDAPSIETLARAAGYRYLFDPASKQYVHPSGVIVLTPKGRISKYFLGVEYPAQDLRLALVEASQESIGTVSDKLLLLCYSYDPSTGKYGFAIMQALRIGGIATVLALALYITLMVRRERRSRTARIAPGEPVQVQS
jgi:protein SCO1/2